MLVYEDVEILFCGQAGEIEQVEKEINLRLQGIGVSLVNDKQHKEIAYMAVTRSTAIMIKLFLILSVILDCFTD